jgi:mono/diheme cytochrome c family protein
MSRGALGLALVATLLTPCAALLRAADDEAKQETPKVVRAEPARVVHSADSEGKAIYRAACATCHGIRGDGIGREGRGFDFPPTNFIRGVYKLRSTTYEKLPTEGDLERTIRDGMSGTEMVPFRRVLTLESIERVAAYIKTFSPRFADPEEALDEKEDIVKLPASRPFELSAESVEAGRQVYAREECGTCHGDSGDGRGPDAAGMTDDWDRPIFMLDWSKGVFKSGTRDQDLYRSIVTGMNGTPMQAYREDLSEEERWRLVDYIRSLQSERGFFGALFGEEPSGTDYR